MTAPQRVFEVLGTFELGQRTDAAVRAPPRHRRLEQRDAETAEVLGEHALARRRVELRQAELEIAPRGAHEGDRQPTQHPAERAAQPHEHPVRERLEQPEQHEPDGRGPVTRREIAKSKFHRLQRW